MRPSTHSHNTLCSALLLFFLAFQGGSWIRIPGIIYGSHVATTVVAVLAEVLGGDYSQLAAPHPHPAFFFLPCANASSVMHVHSHSHSLTHTHTLTHTNTPLTLTLTHSHRLCISICADLTFKEKAMLASVYGPWLIIPLTYVWKLAMDPQPYRKYKRD